MKEMYRNLILELLDTLDGKALESVYYFILGMMEAKKGGRKWEEI